MRASAGLASVFDRGLEAAYDERVAAGDGKKPPLAVVSGEGGRPEVDLDAVLTPRAGGDEERPRLRRDLDSRPGKAGTVVVKTPESQSSFTIYDLEWRIAQLMDGGRGLAQIASEASRLGVQATPELVRSFVRELRGYRFLADAPGATEVKKPADDRSAMTDEERQLLGMAMAMRSRGELDAAANYLLAVLEINPTNHQVRELLREVQQEAASQPAPVEGSPGGRPAWLPWALIGGLAFLVAAGVLTFVFWPRSAPPPVVTQPEPPPEPARKPGLSFRVQLAAANANPIAAPIAGKLLRPIAEGDVVAGAVVAEMLPAKKHARYEKSAREVDRMEAQARRDTVYRYFFEQKRKKHERLVAELAPVAVTAPTAGKLAPEPAPGPGVWTAGATLAAVIDAQRMGATLPTPPPFVPAVCEIALPAGPRNCTFEAPARVVVDNADGAMVPAQVVDVTLWP